MALKTFNPTTPSLRQLVLVDRSDLYKGKPLKSLTEGKSEAGGRNNTGRVTVRFRGGGHKQTYRIIDFKRRKLDMIGKAGRSRWLGRRPHNRGVTMNPVDHPHGGGEGRTSGGRHPVTPWGKPTKGKKTRTNKSTTKFIVTSRHKSKKKG